MARKIKYQDLNPALEQELSVAVEQVKKIPTATVNFRAMLAWKDGIPYLVSNPQKVSKDPATAILELFKTVLDLPYNGTNPSYQGLTNAEAMAISHATRAADGEIDSTNLLLDRINGRPSQKIQAVHLTGNLTDFLDKVASQELHNTVDITPIVETPEEQIEDL